VLEQEASLGMRHEGPAFGPPLRLRLEPSPYFAFLRGLLSGWGFCEESICRRVGMAGLQDARTADQARALLLAPVGGKSSHATVVWSRAGQDRSASIAGGVGGPPPRSDFKQRAGRREGKVPQESVERGADSCLVVLKGGKTGRSCGRWKL
jgi:hypothetical protein